MEKGFEIKLQIKKSQNQSILNKTTWSFFIHKTEPLRKDTGKPHVNVTASMQAFRIVVGASGTCLTHSWQVKHTVYWQGHSFK